MMLLIAILLMSLLTTRNIEPFECDAANAANATNAANAANATNATNAANAANATHYMYDTSNVFPENTYWWYKNNRARCRYGCNRQPPFKYWYEDC